MESKNKQKTQSTHKSSQPLQKRLEQLQTRIEKLAFKLKKFEKSLQQIQYLSKKDYQKEKGLILELIVKISLRIEDKFPDQKERRSVDCQIVFESYNGYVQKMRDIVELEDTYEFKENEEEKDSYISSSERKQESQQVKQSPQRIIVGQENQQLNSNNNSSVKQSVKDTNYFDKKFQDNPKAPQMKFEEQKQLEDQHFSDQQLLLITKKQSLDILNIATYQDEAQITPQQMDQITSIIEGVAQLSQDQLLMIQQTEEKIDQIDSKIEVATIDTLKGGQDLQKASKEKAKGIKYFLSGVFGGIGGVLGAVFGAGVGAGVGAGGGVIVGHSLGSKIEKLTKKKYGRIQFRGPVQNKQSDKDNEKNGNIEEVKENYGDNNLYTVESNIKWEEADKINNKEVGKRFFKKK
eukprot:403349374